MVSQISPKLHRVCAPSKYDFTSGAKISTCSRKKKWGDEALWIGTISSAVASIFQIKGNLNFTQSQNAYDLLAFTRRDGFKFSTVKELASNHVLTPDAIKRLL